MRFVIGLSVVLGLVFVSVAAVLLYLVARSASRLEAMGDAAMVEAQYERARDLYGKSFRKDRTNIRPLEKFCDAIRAWTPTTEPEYLDAFTKLMFAVDELAASKRTDLAAHESFLSFLHDQNIRSGYSRRNADTLIERTTLALSHFETDPGAQEEWRRLKRYRGLATLDILENEPDTLTDLQIERGEEDLREALAANPGDDEAASGLVRWYLRQAWRASSLGRSVEEADKIAKAKAVNEEFRTRHPHNVRMLLSELQMDLELSQRNIPRDALPPVQERMRREAASPLKPKFEALLSRMGGAEARQADVRVLQSLAAIERLMGDATFERTRALVAQAVEARPLEPEMRIFSARLATLAGDFEQAMAEYQAIVDAPLPPVSLRGAVLIGLKSESSYRQADLAIVMWERAESESERASALERVVKYRDQLARRVAESAPQLKIIDAKIAYAKNDMVRAQRLLIDYNNVTGSADPDSIRLLARVEQALNRPGQAREMYARLTLLTPADPFAWLLLGDMNLALQQREDAMIAYQNVLALDPGNAAATERVQIIRAIDNPTTAADPIVQAILTAGAMADGAHGNEPNASGAISLLERAAETHGPDARLIRVLVSMCQREGDQAKAERWAQAGVDAHPEEEEFRRMLRAVRAQGSIEGMMAAIDESEGSEFDKLVAKARVQHQAGNREGAMDLVKRAAAINAEDPFVVEFLFLSALDAKDMAEARRLSQVAARVNSDRVDGLTYLARIQANQGAIADAVATLRQATLMGTATAETWRLLGLMHQELGNGPEALAAFSQAVKLRPTDVTLIVAHIQAMAQVGDRAEALRIAREAEPLAREDRGFSELLLLLEQERGDRQKVVTRREAARTRNPADKNNTYRLTQAHLMLGNWARARELVDELRRESSELPVVELDVAWHADQGRLADAEAAFRRAIEERRAANLPVTTDYYRATARLFIDRGEVDRGMALLQEARPMQDPNRLEVDEELGVVLFALRHFEACLEPLERVLAKGRDEDHSVRTRLAEALCFLGRYDDAQRVIEQAGAAGSSHMPLLLLRATVAQGRGDMPAMGRILDEAVSKFPSHPLPYVKRAEYLRRDQSMLRDALADCNTALRLAPQSWHALQVRALIHNDLGEHNRALDDLRAAVRINPDLDGARDVLLRGLIQMGRINDAATVAKEAAETRPGDYSVWVHFGDFFWGFGLWNEASQFYDRAWGVSKLPDVAHRYALSLLRLPTPDLRRTEAVLLDPAIDVSKNPDLLLTRAMLRQRQNRAGQARQDLVAACRLVMSEPMVLGVLLERLVEILQSPVAASDFVRQLDLTALPDQWAPFIRARFQLMDASAAESALEQIAAVSTQAQDANLRLMAHRLLASHLIQQKKYAEAVEVGIRGLKDDPDNFELNNNTAYLLATELDKAAEALPFAERAAKAAPGNAVVLDTLGVVYMKLNRIPEAIRAFDTALAVTAPPEAHISAAIHYAEAMARLKDRVTSSSMLRTAEDLLRRFPHFKPMFEAKVEEVRLLIDALR